MLVGVLFKLPEELSVIQLEAHAVCSCHSAHVKQAHQHLAHEAMRRLVLGRARPGPQRKERRAAGEMVMRQYFCPIWPPVQPMSLPDRFSIPVWVRRALIHASTLRPVRLVDAQYWRVPAR
jgi:hypothetical protein